MASGLCLSHEARKCFAVGGNSQWQYFQRYPSIHGVLPRLVHDPHAAAPDLAAQRVVAEGAEGRRAQLRTALFEGVELFEELGRQARVLALNLLSV